MGVMLYGITMGGCMFRLDTAKMRDAALRSNTSIAMSVNKGNAGFKTLHVGGARFGPRQADGLRYELPPHGLDQAEIMAIYLKYPLKGSKCHSTLPT